MLAQVQGSCDPQFEQLRILFQQFLDSEEELGASVAVNIDGRDVVDLWGGHADTQRTTPWTKDTIVNVFSTTRNVASLATLILINDGTLSPTDKVSSHWPEFAANGKQDVEIRHVLSHAAGLPFWNDPITVEELCASTEEWTAKLAGQTPAWTPGTASGYHAWTQGLLLGEIIRRKTGLGLNDFIEKRISKPLGADFQLGAREEGDWSRVADLVQPPPMRIPGDTMLAKALLPKVDAGFVRTPAWRKAELGSSNGHTNARGLVRIFSDVVASSRGEGKLLSRRTAESIFDEQVRGADLVLMGQARFGLGYALRGDGEAFYDADLPPGRVAAWGGWGGSMLIMDFDRGVTFAYTMNKMRNEGFATKVVQAYLKAVYGVL